jgi:hypothetical protein
MAIRLVARPDMRARFSASRSAWASMSSSTTSTATVGTSAIMSST